MLSIDNMCIYAIKNILGESETLFCLKMFTWLLLASCCLLSEYPANIFVHKKLSAFYIFCIYSFALQNTFATEANLMDPNQTAP